jgi:hypothetical protein
MSSQRQERSCLYRVRSRATNPSCSKCRSVVRASDRHTRYKAFSESTSFNCRSPIWSLRIRIFGEKSPIQVLDHIS